ncbi:unnamed protein product [Cunninghamella blakesleeana]
MSPRKEKTILRTPSPLNIPSVDRTSPPPPPIPERIKTIRLPKSLKIPTFNERLDSDVLQYQSTKQKQTSSPKSIIDSDLSLVSILSQTRNVYYDNDDDDKNVNSAIEIDVKEEPSSPYIDQYTCNQPSINFNIFEESDFSKTSPRSSKKPCSIFTQNSSVTTSHSFKLHDSFISPSSPPSPTSSSSTKITNYIIPKTSVKSNVSPPSKLPKKSSPKKTSSEKSLSSKSSPKKASTIISFSSNNHRHRIKMESVQKSQKVRLSTSYRYEGKLRNTRRLNKTKSLSDISEDKLKPVLEERKSWINRLRPRNYNKVVQNKKCKANSTRTTTTYGYKYNKPITHRNNGNKGAKRFDLCYNQQSIPHPLSLKNVTRSPSATISKENSASAQIRRSTRILNHKKSSKR